MEHNNTLIDMRKLADGPMKSRQLISIIVSVAYHYPPRDGAGDRPQSVDCRLVACECGT